MVDMLPFHEFGMDPLEGFWENKFKWSITDAQMDWQKDDGHHDNMHNATLATQSSRTKNWQTG